MKSTNILRQYLSVSFILAALLLVAAPAAGQASNDQPLTRADILAYLRSIPKSAVPSPADKEAHARLIALIKQRGVDFVLPRGTFDQEFQNAGMTSLTTWAVWDNHRAPGTASPGAGAADVAFFMKRWAMGISGTSTRFDRQGSGVVRTDQLVGASGGYLDVAPDGTYVWQYASTTPEMRGRWRVASTQELRTEAGQGIVLLRGYDDGDWLVTLRRSEQPGEHIEVRHVSERFRYFIGGRPATESASVAVPPPAPAVPPAPPPAGEVSPRHAHVEEVLRNSSLPFDKPGQFWRVRINGNVLKGFPVMLSVVGDTLLARSTHRPGVSLSTAQVASLQTVQRNPVNVAFLQGEVVAYAGQPIDSLDDARLRQLISGVARAIDDAAALLMPASDVAPPPADATPPGPRLGRYQILSYGNPANPLRVGNIELLAGGTYRYYSAGGQLLGTGRYVFDAAKSALIWQDGLLKDQNWTGTFTSEREGKTHKIRLRGATIAVNNID